MFYVPTVDEVLARCEVRGWWSTAVGATKILDWNGCAILATDLRAALEDAYDPLMPDWPAMVQIDA